MSARRRPRNTCTHPPAWTGCPRSCEHEIRRIRDIVKRVQQRPIQIEYHPTDHTRAVPAFLISFTILDLPSSILNCFSLPPSFFLLPSSFTSSFSALNIASTFSTGTFAWILWTVLKTNPPPVVEQLHTRSRTSRYTSLRCSVRQRLLRVHAAAPEHEVLPVGLLEPCRDPSRPPRSAPDSGCRTRPR